VETVSEDIIARVVEGHRVSFAIARLRGEGQPVGHLVVLALEGLGAEPVVRFVEKECYLPGDKLDWEVVR
jgi:hypothetical protein